MLKMPAGIRWRTRSWFGVSIAVSNSKCSLISPRSSWRIFFSLCSGTSIRWLSHSRASAWLFADTSEINLVVARSSSMTGPMILRTLPTKNLANASQSTHVFCAVGVMVNGYTNIGDNQTGRYLDHPSFAPLWSTLAELEVPLYLHPREPLPSQTVIYDGYPSLVGSAWGFGYETATHAVRLMLSGLFDDHPNVQVILGHLGEGLPFLLPRLEHRLDKQREGVGLGSARQKVGYYFSNNFYLTTSGHFHTRALVTPLAKSVPSG